MKNDFFENSLLATIIIKNFYLFSIFPNCCFGYCLIGNHVFDAKLFCFSEEPTSGAKWLQRRAKTRMSPSR